MEKLFVGFDTSNYTTSAAVADGSGRIIANLKRPLPVKAGECGLRQADAVFAHIKNLPSLVDELVDTVRLGQVEAVGVSSKPRNTEGSYMPCFLSGVAAARSFAAAIGTEVFEFSHQNGHIMAAAYSAGMPEELFGRDFLAFHVSGGTTEALLVKPSSDGFEPELVGKTLDLNAGQIIDRVGVSLGLSFPCGRELEKLALGFEGKHIRKRVSLKGADCNLSGLQNMAEKLYAESGDREAVAAFVFDFIGDTLSAMADAIIDKYGSMPLLFAGGVMSNKYMREALGQGREAYFSEPEFSADNAAGIALLCKRKYDMK